MWLGLAIRVWAIAALGSTFRTSVEVDPGQSVVSNGPYKRLRHPSYIGFAADRVRIRPRRRQLAGARRRAVVVPLPALWRRIEVEEAELNRVLGDPYRAYQTRTKRLMPGLW